MNKNGILYFRQNKTTYLLKHDGCNKFFQLQISIPFTMKNGIKINAVDIYAAIKKYFWKNKLPLVNMIDVSWDVDYYCAGFAYIAKIKIGFDSETLLNDRRTVCNHFDKIRS